MRFNTMLFNIVEKCNIRCRHCGYGGSKRRGKIREDDLVSWVTQAVRYGIRQITFSGGEVFTDFDLLRAGVVAVNDAGGHSGLFTNGLWGTSEENAFEKLRQLPGLNHLHLGCDIYHLEWVPVDYLLNIIKAARQLDPCPVIIINISYANDSDRDEVEQLFASEENLLFHSQRIITNEYVQLKVRDARDVAQPLSWQGFGNDCYLHTPTVHTTGHCWACHIGTVETHSSFDFSSSPYFLGDLHRESLEEIFSRAETNPVYQMLRAFGPRMVTSAALATLNPGEDLRFTSDCDMCHQILPREEVLNQIRTWAEDPAIQRRLFIARSLLGDTF